MFRGELLTDGRAGDPNYSELRPVDLAICDKFQLAYPETRHIRSNIPERFQQTAMLTTVPIDRRPQPLLLRPEMAERVLRADPPSVISNGITRGNRSIVSFGERAESSAAGGKGPMATR